MQCAVLIQTGHSTRINGSIRHGFNGYFHAVFPEFHLAVSHQLVQFTVRQLAQTHRQFKRQIRIILKLPVCQIVITGDDDLRFRSGNTYALRLFVLRDIGCKGRKQLGFVAARRLSVAADDSFDLIRRKRGEIYALRLQVFRDHGSHIVWSQRRSERTARRFLISHNESCESFRRKTGNIHVLLFSVLRNISDDLIRLQQGHIRPGSQLFIASHQTLRDFGCQPTHVCAARNLCVLFNVGNQSLWCEGCSAGAFRHLCIRGNERIHIDLLITGGQPSNNGFCGDRAGILGEFVPSCLCAGHIEIGGDFQHLFGQRFAEHAVQAGQVGLDEIQIADNPRELIQLRRKVDIGEQRLHFCFAHAAVQQRLDLRHQGEVFCQHALVHTGRKRLQIRQQRGLLALTGHAVFAQLRKQLVHLLAGLLDFRLVPHGHDDGRERFGVFLSGGFPLLIVAGIQILQRFLALGFILNQLNQSVFLVVALIDLSVDRRHAFGSSFYCVFIDGRIRIRFTTCLRTGDLGFDLLGDGFKTACFLWSQVILDLNDFAGVDQLLQPDFFLFSQEAVLALFQQPLDLRVHLIQRLNVRCQPLRYTGIAILIGSLFQRSQLITSRSSERFEGIRPLGDDLVALFFSVRPDGQQTIQPFLRGLLIPDKIALRQAEKGQSFAASIEGFGGSIFPLLRCILHALQRFARLFRAGHIIRQRDGACNHGGSNGEPYGGGFT